MIARRIKPILLAAVATAALGTAASATPLPPGGSVIAPPPDVLPGGSTLLADTGLNPFIGKNALNQVLFTGEYEQWVYSDSVTGDLDFVTRVTNDPTSADAVDAVSLTDYAGFTTDVAWLPASPGTVIPLIEDRQASGDTIDFTYTGPTGQIMPGVTAFDTIVKTNATRYTTGTINLIDGGVSTDPAFAPAVPEPGSLALLATGGLPLLGFLRRRKLA
jgi:hypothetical protein